MLHSFILEKMVATDVTGLGQNGEVLLAESDRRVRKALKLVA